MKDYTKEYILWTLVIGLIIFAIASFTPQQLDYACSENNKTLEQLVLETFNTYINLNFFIERVKEYKEYGRTQTKDQAIELDSVIKNILIKNDIKYTNIKGDIKAPSEIVQELFGELT